MPTSAGARAHRRAMARNPARTKLASFVVTSPRDPAGAPGRTYQVRGAVLDAWRADAEPWQPLGDECAIAGGVVQHFVHRMTAALASICSHPHTGTWWVTGAVSDRWYEAGAQLGRFA